MLRRYNCINIVAEIKAKCEHTQGKCAVYSTHVQQNKLLRAVNCEFSQYPGLCTGCIYVHAESVYVLLVRVVRSAFQQNRHDFMQTKCKLISMNN